MKIPENQLFWCLGLMSGTSLDGIDAALIRTDGEVVAEQGKWLTLPYTKETRERIRGAIAGTEDIPTLERDLTFLHVEAVETLLAQISFPRTDIRVIGFHGQTIAHKPNEGITWQIGDGALLAQKTGIDVVCDFRKNDVANGGQGAPLVPLYHAALMQKQMKPVAVLNLGGVANVTFIDDSTILAFDTGPGNAMLNDWIEKRTGKAFDEDGKIAAAGKVNTKLVEMFLQDLYFVKRPPKSLDRNHFSLKPYGQLVVDDGAATLVECVAASIKRACEYFPSKPRRWYLCGGGRHNPTITAALARHGLENQSIDSLGYSGDALEAQAFGYLAMRSLRRLPLSLPKTTGVTRAVTGGVFYPGARGA